MISVQIPGQLLLLSAEAKTDSQGNQAVGRKGEPLTRAVVVSVVDGQVLAVTVPTSGVAPSLTALTSVHLGGAKVGAFKDNLFWHADSIRPATSPTSSRGGVS